MAIAAPNWQDFSVDDWERIRVFGFFGEDEGVEPIDAEIVDISPLDERHAPSLLAPHSLIGVSVAIPSAPGRG